MHVKQYRECEASYVSCDNTSRSKLPPALDAVGRLVQVQRVLARTTLFFPPQVALAEELA